MEAGQIYRSQIEKEQQEETLRIERIRERRRAYRKTSEMRLKERFLADPEFAALYREKRRAYRKQYFAERKAAGFKQARQSPEKRRAYEREKMRKYSFAEMPDSDIVAVMAIFRTQGRNISDFLRRAVSEKLERDGLIGEAKPKVQVKRAKDEEGVWKTDFTLSENAGTELAKTLDKLKGRGLRISAFMREAVKDKLIRDAYLNEEE